MFGSPLQGLEIFMAINPGRRRVSAMLRRGKSRCSLAPGYYLSPLQGFNLASRTSQKVERANDGFRFLHH